MSSISWKPELNNKDQVLGYYAQFDTPYFYLYANTKPDKNYLRWDYVRDDKTAGLEVLSDALDSILANPANNNVYLLQIFMEEPDENTGKKTSTGRRFKGRQPESKCITFQLNGSSLQPYTPGVMVSGVDNSVHIKLNELSEKYDRLLQALEDREQDPEPQQSGTLGAILSNPAVQPLIEAAVMGLIAKFTGSDKPQAPAAINGIAEVPSVEQVLTSLNKSVGMTFEDLIKLSEYANRSPFQCKLYLNMLRSKFI